MDKLREKGPGPSGRYQRTLESETPELLDRKLRAIEQYRKEMERQMRHKKVLTQKALRQKARGRVMTGRRLIRSSRSASEDEVEIDAHMKSCARRSRGCRARLRVGGGVQQRQERRQDR